MCISKVTKTLLINPHIWFVCVYTHVREKKRERQLYSGQATLLVRKYKSRYLELQDLISFQDRNLPSIPFFNLHLNPFQDKWMLNPLTQKDKKNRLWFFCYCHQCTRGQILLCNKITKSPSCPFSGVPQINTKTWPCVFIQKVRTGDVLYTDTMLDSIVLTPSHTYLQHTLLNQNSLRKSPPSWTKTGRTFWSFNVLDAIIWEGGLKILLPAGLPKLDREMGKKSIHPP